MDGVVGSDVKVVESPRRSARCCEFFLRLLGLVLTLLATILVGVDKQTTVVPVTVANNLPPLNLSLTAKWQYTSAFVYLVVSNAIACFYSAASLVWFMGSQSPKTNGALVINILDLIIMGLLYSANGAAAAIGVVGRNGNTHLQWTKVCNVFDHYCHLLAAALVVSLLASFVFFCLLLLAVLNHHKKIS